MKFQQGSHLAGILSLATKEVGQLIALKKILRSLDGEIAESGISYKRR
jgi:hypothetical protein